MTAQPRLLRRAAVTALAAAGLAAATSSPWAAAAPHPAGAHAARSCSTPRYPGSGYFTSLSVHGVSCATGSKLAVDYYRCRLRHGKSGHCTSTVDGFRCSETRQSISTEFNARVTCRRSRSIVVHTYQQNT